MRKNTVNFLVDAVSLLVMLGMIATGLVIRFLLPPGTGGREGGPRKVLWGLGRHDWGDVHFWLAVAIGVLMLVHVALHWAWVCATVRKLFLRRPAGAAETTPRTRNLYGIAFLVIVVAVLAAFFAIAWTNAVTLPGGGEHEAGHRGGRQGVGQSHPAEEHGEHGGHEPGMDPGQGWGSMALNEIESTYGVPVEVIRKGLGLPDTVSPDERLGRLRHEYGFEMSTVHRLIQEYQSQPRP